MSTTTGTAELPVSARRHPARYLLYPLRPPADHEARERPQRVEEEADGVAAGADRQLDGCRRAHASLRTRPTRATTWSITSSRE